MRELLRRDVELNFVPRAQLNPIVLLTPSLALPVVRLAELAGRGLRRQARRARINLEQDAALAPQRRGRVAVHLHCLCRAALREKDHQKN